MSSKNEGKIVAALDQLDHTNDEHWTTDGQPKLEVVMELSGLTKLTRKQVSDAAPDFARLGSKPEPDEPDAKDPVPEPDEPDAKDPVPEPDAPVAAEPVSQDEALRIVHEELAVAEAHLNEALANHIEATNKVAMAQNDVYLAQLRLSRLERVHPDMNAINVQRYLATQREQLRIKGQLMREATAAEARHMAPIDAARARWRP